MKKLISASIILLLGVLLMSCTAHINELMKSWEGHHYSELIASWGPPQQVFDDGYGGRIFIYTQIRQWAMPGKSTTYTKASATIYDDYIWGSAISKTTYYPSQIYSYTAYRMFWVNKDGFIYGWSWKGL